MIGVIILLATVATVAISAGAAYAHAPWRIPEERRERTRHARRSRALDGSRRAERDQK